MQGSILLAGSIAMACFAQVTLIQAYNQPGFWEISNWLPNLASNASPLPGLALYALSGWIFTRGLSDLGQSKTFFNISTLEIQQASPRFGFWITNLGISVLLAFAAASSTAYNYGPALAVTWLINIALLIASVLIETSWRMPSFNGFIPWLGAHRLEILGITLIASAAFLLRFWNMELLPYSFVNDEGQMGLTGACLLDGSCKNLFTIGWAAQPMLSFVPTSLSLLLLGRTASAVRLASVIIGTLAVVAVYLFTRVVFGRKEAWVAMALLTVLPVHVHFSRLGVTNIIDSLSTTAVLGLLFLGMKRGSTLGFLAAGILGGLCMYTYPGTRLAPILGLSALGFVVWRVPGFLKAQAHNILIFGMAMLVTAAPIAGYFSVHTNLFFARMNTEGIFQNHAFEGALQAGNSALGILTNQFMRSSLVFIVTNAPSNFYNSPNPYITPLAAIFFMLGLAFVLSHIKQERYFILFIWFWAAIILGSTLTGGPPSSQRMLMSTPALVIITAIGVCKLMENIPQRGRITPWLQIAGLLIFVAWVGYKDVRFYFYDYQVGHYYEDPTNELTYESAVDIAPLHDTGRFYLLAEPGVPYLSFPSFEYFSPDVDKAYLDTVTPQSLAEVSKDKDALFIALPSRLGDLQKLAALLPGGKWREVPRRYQPANMLYYSYEIKKNALRAINP